MFRDAIQQMKREVKENPDKYPEIPGQEYWIVVCDSDGSPIRTGGRRVKPRNPKLEVMSFQEGDNPKKTFLCYKVN